jgi:hypothetical protein
MEQQRNGGHEQQPERPAGAIPLHGAPTMPEDRLPRDSGDRVHPRHQVVLRAAGRIACGQLGLEPILGPVHVSATPALHPDPHGADLVRVTWSDDDGPCHATANYSTNRVFPVRVPAREDWLLVRHALDGANWRNRALSGATARLIAAHLHLGHEAPLLSPSTAPSPTSCSTSWTKSTAAGGVPRLGSRIGAPLPK